MLLVTYLALVAVSENEYDAPQDGEAVKRARIVFLFVKTPIYPVFVGYA